MNNGYVTEYLNSEKRFLDLGQDTWYLYGFLQPVKANAEKNLH